MLSLEINKKHSQELLSFYDNDFEWFVTPSFKEGTPIHKAEKIIRDWRINLAKSTRLQIATLGMYATKALDKDSCHIHLLVRGFNRHGESLQEIGDEAMRAFERDMLNRTHCECNIKKVWSVGVVGYFLGHHFKSSRTENIVCIHNLKKLKRLKNDGKQADH